jgi:CHRD domain/PEP-CTERM motif
MNKHRRVVVLAVVLLVAAALANGATLLVANISPANENPPTTPTLTNGAPRPLSIGMATFLLNDAQTAMTMTVTISNVDFGGQSPDPNDDLIAAHIHASPTACPTCPNAGVVWGFFGSPFNDNNPNDRVITPFTTGVGGTITGKWDAPEGNGTTLTAQLQNILTGHSYINFHTTQYGGGETRGFLEVVTPEPGTVVLLTSGLLGIAARAWRRRKSA